MELKELLKNVEVISVEGNVSSVFGICYNSKKVKKGDLFFCIRGMVSDGHDYIDDVVKNGAVALVVSKDIPPIDNVAIIKVADTRVAMAEIAGNYYKNPSKDMNIIGVTGTNGKTTTTFMIKSIIDLLGEKTALFGTIYNMVGDVKNEASRTTPESMDLHELFYNMNKDDIKACVMEVSSHSLELKRVHGVHFKVGVFTNLTQDHLDFHKNMDEYFYAKMKLFNNSEYAVINIDDEYGKKAIDIVPSKVITYGIDNKADLRAENIIISHEGNTFDLCYNGNKIPFKINIPGKFNVYNALACIGTCLACNLPMEDIQKGLATLQSVPGRSERFNFKKGFTVVLDYAHTPDGILNILKSAREYTKNRLIILFGCGGDRDRTKRPIMGSMAGLNSDYCIVTSDNPRSEDPDAIIEDILPGVKGTNCEYKVIPDRRAAIDYAVKMAQSGDVIVIAGKGHETYQILKDETIHFDEKEIVMELLRRE